MRLSLASIRLVSLDHLRLAEYFCLRITFQKAEDFSQNHDHQEPQSYTPNLREKKTFPQNRSKILGTNILCKRV